MFKIEKAIETFKKYDKIQNNPDIYFIEKMIVDQLQENGLLKLCIFVCPKFNTRALLSRTTEQYMPIKTDRQDLFEQRIKKILSLKKDLMKAGLPTEINVILGDNDAEEYIFPFINSFVINSDIYKQRQNEYCISFKKRCLDLFGETKFIVWSLSELGISQDIKEPSISKNAMEKEINFFKWLFSDNGPYLGILNFTQEILTEMVRIKYKLYGAQGEFLEMLGGVLLQTEGPGVWMERTNMFKCTGSNAIPAIYPWIRDDEIIN